MKKVALLIFAVWISPVKSSIASTKTADIEQLAIKKEPTILKKKVAEKPIHKTVRNAPTTNSIIPQKATTAHPKQEYVDTPLITVCNTTLETETQSPIIIKANCVSETNGVATKFTKILTAATANQDSSIKPQTFQVLQVPEGAFELWAEQVNSIDNFFEAVNPIPFYLKNETEILTFQIRDGKNMLQFISPLEENTLLFYNQTNVDQVLTFASKQNLLGFSYFSRQVSFTLPAQKIVTMPLPQNVVSWTIGTNNPCDVPAVGTKKIYCLTPKTMLTQPDPVITELKNRSL